MSDSDIVTKYMSPTPRDEAVIRPIYSALTPARPETPGSVEPPAEPAPSPTTTAEMTYRVVKKLLEELPLPERIACLRRLSKDIFTEVIP